MRRHKPITMNPTKPTLHTLCQATGLSVATVSRALAGLGSVSPATRDKVLAAAQALNYVPDRAAVRLKTGRTQVLAFVMDRFDASQPGHQALMMGLSEEARRHDYHLVVLPSPPNDDPLATVRYVVERRMADALVLSHTKAQDERVAYLLQRDFPFITHGRTELSSPHAWVDWDNAAFAEQAVQTLADRGRRRLGLLLPQLGSLFRGHLIEGFTRACAARGLAGQIVETVSLDDPPEAIFRWALRHGQSFDGWVVSREAPVLPLLGALNDLQRAVGRDIELVTKYSSTLAHYIRQPLLVSFEDLHITGRSLARGVLQQLLPGSAEAPPGETLLCELIPPGPIEVFPTEVHAMATPWLATP